MAWTWSSGYNLGGYGGSGTGTAASSASNTGHWWDWLGESDTSGSPNWLNAAQLAIAGAGAYNAFKDPKYQSIPLSPEQQALYKLYMGQATDPRTANNRGIAADFAKGQLAQVTPNMPWNRSTPFSMAYMGLNQPTINGGSGNDSMNYLLQLLSGGGGGGGAQTNTFPGQSLPKQPPPAEPGSNRAETGRLQPFNRTWEPASGFPLSPSSPQEDPNKEVSIDPRFPLANQNPTGATGSSYGTAREMGPGTLDPETGTYRLGTPAGMKYSSGPEVAGFAQWLQGQGVKDGARIAVALFTGGLVGASLAAAKTLWSHYQNSKGSGQPTTAPSGKP